VASGAERYRVFESAESVASGSAARVIREAATEHRLTVAYGLVEHGEGIGDYWSSRIVDPLGHIVAGATGAAGLLVADVDVARGVNQALTVMGQN
jgi:predicted amidohydrolase